MKILLITNEYPPDVCGIGDYTKNLCENLLDLEHEICIITKSKVLNQHNSNLALNTISNWSISDFGTIKKIIKKHNPDIIHIQFPNIKSIGYYLLPMLLKLSGVGKKTIITIHEHTYKTIVGKLANIVAVLFSTAIIITENGYKKTFKWFNKNIFTLPVLSNIPKSTLNADEQIKLREKLGIQNKKLVSYFGFIVDHKGVDLLFEVCNPQEHFILLIGDIKRFYSHYSQKIEASINSEKWKNASLLTGFVPEQEVANLLYASDVCLFPFKNGAGERNASLNAAILQGTFTITTHQHKRGYESEQNLFYTAIDDIGAMQTALKNSNQYVDAKKQMNNENPWKKIALAHIDIYKKYVG
jgi:glycosyltransferase involved in cell wall biosynthesis